MLFKFHKTASCVFKSLSFGQLRSGNPGSSLFPQPNEETEQTNYPIYFVHRALRIPHQ
jgi:hypothetical protein